MGVRLSELRGGSGAHRRDQCCSPLRLVRLNFRGADLLNILSFGFSEGENVARWRPPD